MSTKALYEIATVQTGLFAKSSTLGQVNYLQSKYFNEKGQILNVILPKLYNYEIPKKHILRIGDVLFAAKGERNFAYVYEGDQDPSVASTSFFVIRLSVSNILPEYLAWFLNNHITQKTLKGQAIGTSIPSISKQVLENLEITIPSIKKQQAIFQVTILRQKERALKQKIEMLKEQHIQQQIINAIKK
jgi:restriction endonuclease S subunit